MRKEEVAIVSFALFLFVFSFVSAIPAQELSVNSTTLSDQITLSQPISNLFSVLFNLNSTTLNLQSAVFLAVLFLCVFLVVHSVIHMIPFFENKYSAFFVSIIITLLSSMSGGMNYAYSYLTSLSKQFNFISNSNSLSLFIPLTLIIFVSVVLIFIIQGIKKTISKEEAHSVGFQIGKNIGESKMYSTIFKKNLDNN